jgi:hypothetical protein
MLEKKHTSMGETVDESEITSATNDASRSLVGTLLVL